MSRDHNYSFPCENKTEMCFSVTSCGIAFQRGSLDSSWLDLMVLTDHLRIVDLTPMLEDRMHPLDLKTS
jgi:hypothetical protein